MRTSLKLALLTVAAALLPGAGAAPPVLKILVTPGPMDQQAGKGEVAVAMTIPAIGDPGDGPLLSIDLMVPGMARPLAVRGLTARDAGGTLSLTAIPGPPGRWRADRAVRGPLALDYILEIENVPMLQGGPPTAARIDGNAFSAIGSGLFMKVPPAGPTAIRLDWDFARMASGSEAVTSWGNGAIALGSSTPDRLMRGVFMVGRLMHEPRQEVKQGFSAVWAGDPGFDPRPPMQWTAKLHGWMSGFFGDTEVPPYRVFMRYNPMNAGGGAALHRSFLITYGTGVTGQGLAGILGHEMTHTWTANDLGKWYSEGNAVYYQVLLPWRAGLVTTDEYLADINETASRYYSNLLRNTPEEEAVRRFWEDTRVRVLPYDRGALYFAALDGKIRRASGGKRSIDDLVLAMVDRAKKGEPITEAIWFDMLRAEIGEAGPTLHRAMLAGDLILPESGDYGPCFRRTTRPVRRFDVGFDFASLIGAKKVVKGLKPDSEAARAGLRDGDVITYGVALDSLQGAPDRHFNVQVTRDGRTWPVSYLPRGEAVDVYQWEREPGVPDDQCKLRWGKS
ncbi:M61 family metallopeptidase [Sphingomonas sp.]|uniref:M61 family metallopeptidase n=1 Tax=Sphingomonas sp. TaxID=28214 RepID=UPI002DD6B3D1|nr:peptidase M61 [Sphingomonas sp.]